MQILVNGEPVATDARTLAELCATLGFAQAKVATAVNGSFVASAKRGADARAQGRGRDRCAEAGRLMLDIYGERFKSRLLLGTAQYPPRQRFAKRSGVVRRDRHRFAEAQVGGFARAKASGS